MSVPRPGEAFDWQRQPEARVGGFWSSETMKIQLPRLISPFNPDRVVNCSYELSMGAEAYVTSSEAQTKRTLHRRADRHPARPVRAAAYRGDRGDAQ
jgi:hypothetical protein